MQQQKADRALNATLALLIAAGVLSLALYLLVFTQPYMIPPRTYAIVPPVDVGKLSAYSTEAGVTYFGVVFVLFLGYLFAWLGVRG